MERQTCQAGEIQACCKKRPGGNGKPFHPARAGSPLPLQSLNSWIRLGRRPIYEDPEPLLEHKARIYKEGSIVMQKSVVVGIDVSKNTLDYTWLPEGTHLQTENNPKGIASLIRSVKKLQPEIVVLEATGGYQNQLVVALRKARLPVHVANPRQIRDFARSLNRLGKTDALDALSIAQFAQSRKLPAQEPKAEPLVSLSSMLLRREQLQGMLTAEKGHLEHTREPFRQEVLEHMDILKQRIAAVEKQLEAMLKQHPALARADAIIRSIPGVGLITSATLIADLPEMTTLGRKQIASLVGLAPFNRDSGKYRGQRHIFGGRARIRKVLYCILRPCLRCNPRIKAWFDHFLSKGKPYKVAAIACCRKLLVVIRSMLISKTMWRTEGHT